MFGQKDFHKDSRLHEHNYRHDAYGHTHGAIDTAILTTQRGIWAIKWSFFWLLALLAIFCYLILVGIHKFTYIYVS